MRKHSVILALTIALSPVLSACDSGLSTFGPDDVVIANADAADYTIDLASLDGGSVDGSLFNELAEKIPGFGGFWFDRGCNLNVVLTMQDQKERAVEILQPYLLRYVESHRCPRDASVVVHPGEFTWKQLSGWLRLLEPATRIEGVERIGISIPSNRIVVAVTGRLPARDVLRLAGSRGVNTGAIKFVLASSTASDRTRDGTTDRSAR